MKWYTKVLSQYADFGGRARRTEYWMFALINVVITIILVILDTMIGTLGEAGFGLLSGLYSLAVLLPSLAVSVRRLHDTNRSGWWVLISLVPFVGGIVLLIFCVLEGDRGYNQYGPDPKEVTASTA
jgi:uncharacterized membrane protein YhaH (DUF805 family)